MPIHGYLGGVISATAPTISPTSASGVWTLDDQLQNAANWPSQSNIARSLRFNSADSAYLNRTPSVAGNRKTWTWSGWIKRSALGSTENIFTASDASGINEAAIYFGTSNQLLVYSYISAYQLELKTTQVFRDVGSWGHLLIAVDTTQATSTNRAKIYWNGVQITDLATATYPSQNYDTYVNTTQPHYISRDPNPGAGGRYLNAYLADVYFIDGQALTPSSFGYTDSNGIWQPNSYTGSYGTNGFWLNFDDNSGTTATTLGKDSSGNGNNWTPNNFSVTAGTGNDSLVDSPTNYGTDTGVGGEVRGNYCTLNPIANPSTPTYSITNGNLDYATTGSSGVAYQQAAIATIGITTGKWYFESTVTSNNPGLGFSSMLPYQAARGTIYITYFSGSLAKSSGISSSGTPATFTNGDVIGVAYDADAGTATVYKNNVSQGTFSGIPTGTPLFPYVEPNTAAASSGASFNFGQRPFAYTAPAGFRALCSTNLPTPTIQKGSSYFNTVLWTGDGSYPRTITGVGFQPDFVWTKSRSSAFSHISYDVVRGTGTTKSLSQNETSAEGANSSNANLTAFTSDGFTVDSTTGTNVLNKNLDTFVAWNWKANGAGSSNTAGSITSTVSANQTAGFSIVTYTGNGTSGATVGHGLGAVPQMIIAKTRNNLGDWPVYHVSIGNTKNLLLNTSGAETTSSSWWNNTTPTSTLVTLGNNSYINGNTYTFVMYCFAPVAGYSAFGSYTGNGSSDGPFIYTGFRPAYVLVKNSSSARDWAVWDVKRNTFNLVNTYLTPNSSAAESSDNTVSMDILSNGFKVRGTWVGMNNSGETIIYAAFAENPFKIARAR